MLITDKYNYVYDVGLDLIYLTNTGGVSLQNKWFSKNLRVISNYFAKVLLLLNNC